MKRFPAYTPLNRVIRRAASVAATGMMAFLFLMTAAPVEAQELFWVNRTSPPTAQNLFHVAYLNNQFFALGETATLLTSLDGLVWTPRHVPTARRLYSVTYGNGRYLTADDNGTIFSSPDADEWAPATPID